MVYFNYKRGWKTLLSNGCQDFDIFACIIKEKSTMLKTFELEALYSVINIMS